MIQNSMMLDTDRIKDIISHASQSRVKCMDIKGDRGFFVEFFDGPASSDPKEIGEPAADEEIEPDESGSGVKRQKEYPGQGMVSEEDSLTLMNPNWKE